MKYLPTNTNISIFIMLFLSNPTIDMQLQATSSIDFSSPSVIEQRKKEEEDLRTYFLRVAQLYDMPDGVLFKNITQDIIDSNDISETTKTIIKEQQRTFMLFTYPSDVYRVKAVISYTPDVATAPLLLFLRGGNRLFGLMHPGHSFNVNYNYTVISPVYRGGVSEGTDEFGGNDVNDIKNLVDFIPQLKTMLNIPLNPPKKYIIGGSRGGMQMLLALQRNPCLQKYFDKAVSISGLYNLKTCIEHRTDMKEMFYNDFGLSNENAENWLSYRNPEEHCEKLYAHFPILIIQGAMDNRSHVSEAQSMVATLKALEKNVTYHEIEEGNHCLSNVATTRDKIISEWLES